MRPRAGRLCRRATSGSRRATTTWSCAPTARRRGSRSCRRRRELVPTGRRRSLPLRRRVLRVRNAAVIMTGMGQDGLRGCQQVREAGGQLWRRTRRRRSCGGCRDSSLTRALRTPCPSEGHRRRDLPTRRGQLGNPFRARRRSEGARHACKCAPDDLRPDLVYRRSSIVIEAGKEYLVESRLAPLARAEGFASIDDLVATLRSQPANGLHAGSSRR